MREGDPQDKNGHIYQISLACRPSPWVPRNSIPVRRTRRDRSSRKRFRRFEFEARKVNAENVERYIHLCLLVSVF
jgi:hypothetical protein